MICREGWEYFYASISGNPLGCQQCFGHVFTSESNNGVAILLVDSNILFDMVLFLTEDVGVEALHVLVPMNALESPECDWVGEVETNEYVHD